MKNDLASFSTDLLRISRFIYDGQDNLVERFLDFCRVTYSKMNPKVGCYQNIWQELDKIQSRIGGRLQAAERALTLSRIMMMYTGE